MRILHADDVTVLTSVLIMLTPDEAAELADGLRGLDPKTGDHIHVSDETFTREITIAVYTPENLKFFAERIRRLIETGE
jgi:hypothetical protein